MSVFKKGNKVIRQDLDSPYIYKIRSVTRNDAVVFRDNSHRLFVSVVGLDYLRKATPKEIEQGYRDE